jgi:hypothetical protein
MPTFRTLAWIITALATTSGVAASGLAAQGRSSDQGRPVLLFDDFSRVDPNWLTEESIGGTARIVDGALRVRNETPSVSATVALYDAIFDDQVIEVEMTLVDGTDDNWQTVICRSNDDGYYSIGISADGYYALAVFVGGSQQDQSLGPSRSSSIRTGTNAMNLVQVECVGDRLRLIVNGSTVAELSDGNHRKGRSGVSVSSLAGRFSRVAFDNLRITRP